MNRLTSKKILRVCNYFIDNGSLAEVEQANPQMDKKILDSGYKLFKYLESLEDFK